MKWSGEMMKLCDGNGGKVEKEPWQKAKGIQQDQGEQGLYSDFISFFFYNESTVQ